MLWLRRSSAAVTVVIFVVCEGLFLLPTASPCRAGEVASPDPFETLNQAFRTAYADARRELIQGSGPILMSRGDYLVLFYRGERFEGEKADTAYHQLKTVAHVPLGVYVMLAGYTGPRLPDAKLAQLEEFHALLAPAQQAVERSNLTPTQQARQQQVLDRCTSFLDRVLAEKTCNPLALRQFCSRCSPALMQNALEATQVRLDAYHRQVLAWRKKFTPDDWRGLRAVVVGAQMPRAGNLATQYFARLFREAGVHTQIIYAEALFEEEKALHLLGTHQLDASAAQAFFHEPRRLHRDLLSNATTAALETLDWTPFRGLGER